MSFRSRTTRRTCGRISSWLSTSRFFPLASFDSGPEKAHGRIEQRSIEVLPAAAAGIESDWPSVTHICRITRSRQVRKGGHWQERAPEVVHLIARFPKPAPAEAGGEVSPQAILNANRSHWGIEIMHRNKDVILGEDGYTNRSDAAPQNVFSLIGFALRILKSVSPSLTRAIEHFQDDKNRALNCFAP